jgi:hypothetical protein
MSLMSVLSTSPGTWLAAPPRASSRRVAKAGAVA